MSEEVIDELFVRFFTDVTSYNCNMSKCFWQLEKMYWYYLDTIKSSQVPSRNNMKIFLDQIKDYLKCMLPTGLDLDAEYKKWCESRKTIPRCKVILMDHEMKHVVLTKGKFNEYVMFPGGKVEQTDKDLTETAIRETYEEIGVDITNKIIPGLYFDFHQYGVKNRYFVVPNIDRSTFMHPNVAHEIEYIKWFPLKDIPNNMTQYNITQHNMKLMIPAVEQLKIFIQQQQQRKQ